MIIEKILKFKLFSTENKKTKFIWKTFWCIIYGCILSFILYNFVYTQLPKNIPHIWILFLTALSCLCAIILCRSSIQFRCVTVLVWLESFGKAGRSGIKALVIMLILSGPIENTISNVREVVRVVECTSFLTYNLTKTKVDLALKPFTNTFSRMDRHLMDVERTFHRITTFIHPLIQEIEQKSHDSIPSDTESFNVKSADFYESIFKKKLKKRCQAQVMEGVHTCEKAFEKAYNNCLEEIPTAIRYAICWPFNIDLICGLENTFISSFVNTCDPSNVIDSSFGVEYMQLKEMGKQFMTHAANISIKYKTNEKPTKVVSSMNETNNKIKKNFDEKANSVYDLMNVFEKILLFIYLKIIYDAIKFHDDYLDNIEFNNFYLTNYFKEIDERRRRAGRSNVLPLRKIDIGKYVDLHSNNSSNYKMCKEFEGYIGLTVEFFLQFIITSFFVLLDQLLYKVLQIIARHSRVNYLQEGVHNLNITVNGTGFISNLIRESIDGFNIDERIKVAMTNEPCLPRPLLVESFKIIRIYLLLLLNLYLIYNQVYIHRSKYYVCSFFYPKRERARILYLYRKILKRRKIHFKLMVQRVKERLEIHGRVKQTENFFQKSLRAFPTLCKCLQCFSIARPKCFICNETQDRKMTKDSIYYQQCQKRKCRIIYCEQCWLEIGRRCLACKYRRKYVTRTEEEIAVDSKYYMEYYKSDISE